MFTDKDVTKLIEVFATREEIRELVAPLATKKDVSQLYSAVDAYAKKADTYFQEMVALNSKVSRLEQAVKKIAQKVGVDIDL